MELIDTHCHLDLPPFDADRARVLAGCRENGVRRLVIPAVQSSTWETLTRLCSDDDNLFPALGLHPVFLDQHSDADVDALRTAVARYHPVAIGEIGLDYFLAELDPGRQQDLFERQLDVAIEHNLPVILHVRKAHDMVLSTLRRVRPKGGIVHAFNGSFQQAEQYMDLGFKLGFGGTLTWPGSHKIHRLANQLPLSAIVLETDAPDMPVASHKGERNSPEYLPECLHALALIRDEDPEQIALATTANAVAVLDLV